MMFMNQSEVEEAAERFDADETPNLHRGAQVLSNLMDWTNSHSDGWAYWPKPVRAAKRLMEVLEAARRERRRDDITGAELTAALRPIKSFLTRQDVKHDEVFKGEA